MKESGCDRRCHRAALRVHPDVIGGGFYRLVEALVTFREEDRFLPLAIDGHPSRRQGVPFPWYSRSGALPRPRRDPRRGAGVSGPRFDPGIPREHAWPLPFDLAEPPTGQSVAEHVMGCRIQC